MTDWQAARNRKRQRVARQSLIDEAMRSWMRTVRHATLAVTYRCPPKVYGWGLADWARWRAKLRQSGPVG